MGRAPAYLSALTLFATLSACREPAKPVRQPAAPQWMVGERFPIGAVSCRVDAAQPRLTELPNKPSSRRVSPDVHVLTLALACETAQGSPVTLAQALPKATVILLSTAGGKRIAPSTRTWLSEEQPELLVFEVAPEESLVAGTRRYDAMTGQRTTAITTRFGVLSLQTPKQRADVLLRERAVDAAFEQALDELLERLATGRSVEGTTDDGAADHGAADHGAAGADDDQEQAPLAARKLHLSILEHTGARMFSVQVTASGQGPPGLTLSYEQTAQAPASPALQTVRLTLSPLQGAPPLRIEAVEEQALLQRALRCARERAELRTRAAQAYGAQRQNTQPKNTQPKNTQPKIAQPKIADCHVLGLLLPGPCESGDPGLLKSALEVLGRCVEPASLAAKKAAPSDFQLTLRRGRTSSALDRSPRYTLSLFSQGQVVFHGRHWVNSLGRSDGRTGPEIINGLYAHMRSLGWFERKGGEWSARGCSPEDEQGNVLTLHAGGRERMILDRAGCRGPFSEQELSTLHMLIEAAAGIASFTQERAIYADPEARIWTVE